MPTTTSSSQNAAAMASSSTMISSQKNSAARIRSRFLHKIGIGQIPPTQQAAAAGPTTSKSGLALSCLGDVTPFNQPLKVGLESDSSSMDEDEDFYFGDEEDDFNAIGYMATPDPSLMSPHPTSSVELNTTVQSSFADLVDTSTPITAPSTLLPVVSDEGSSHSASQTSLDSFASASSFRSTSTGCMRRQSANGNELRKNSRKKRRVSLNHSVSVVPIPMRSEYSDRARERLWSSATELYTNAARNSIEFASEGWNWRTVTEDEHMILCEKSGELIHPIHIHNLLIEHGLIPEGVPMCMPPVVQGSGQAPVR